MQTVLRFLFWSNYFSDNTAVGAGCLEFLPWNYEDFVYKFRSMFVKGLHLDTLARRFISPWEGKSSVADYSAEFWVLLKRLTGKKRPLEVFFFFCTGYVRMNSKLAAKGLWDSLNSLIAMCIRIEEHIWEHWCSGNYNSHGKTACQQMWGYWQANLPHSSLSRFLPVPSSYSLQALMDSNRTNLFRSVLLRN